MPANPQEEGSVAECESSTDRQGEVAVGHQGTLDLDEVLSNIGVGHFHTRLLLVCGLGFSAVAVEVVLLAFLIPELRLHWNLDEYNISLLATSSSAASIIGQLVWGTVADRFGRRLCFMVTVLFVAIFGCLAALSVDFVSLICFRACVGFCLGGSISVDFALYSEFFPTKERGHWLFRMQVFWPVGQLMACMVAWCVIPQCGWRIFLVVCAVPSLLSALVRPLVPESPRWLLVNGRLAEAKEVCRHMAIMNGLNPEDVGLHAGTSLSKPSNTTTSSTPLRGRDPQSKGSLLLATGLLSKSLVFTTMGIVLFSAALHAMTYANLTFMPSMLSHKGVAWNDRYPMMVLTTLAEIPGVCLMLFISKHMGCLMPMKLNLLVCGLLFLIFAAAEGTVPIVFSICCCSFFLEACWGCFHVYIPEVYPTELRATAVGWLSSVGSLMAAGAPLSAAFLLESFNISAVCIFFAMCAFAGSIGTFLFLHIETFHRNLRDLVQQSDEDTFQAKC